MRKNDKTYLHIPCQTIFQLFSNLALSDRDKILYLWHLLFMDENKESIIIYDELQNMLNIPKNKAIYSLKHLQFLNLIQLTGKKITFLNRKTYE